MTISSHEYDELRETVRKLEDRLRRMDRLLIVLGLLALSIGLFHFMSPVHSFEELSAETIEARTFLVRNRAGVVQARLESSGGGELTLYGGDPREPTDSHLRSGVFLGARDGSASLHFRGTEGQRRLELNQGTNQTELLFFRGDDSIHPGFLLRTADRPTRSFKFWLTTEDTLLSMDAIDDHETSPQSYPGRASLNLNRRGRSISLALPSTEQKDSAAVSIELTDDRGRHRAGIQIPANGPPALSLSTEGLENQLFWSTSAGTGGIVPVLADKHGKVLWRGSD